MLEFLKAKNLIRPLVLINFCEAEEMVITSIAEPLIARVAIGGRVFKPTMDADVPRATPIAIWKMSGQTRNKVAAPPTATAATTVTTTATETNNKAPKKLTAGVWASQMEKYNDTLIVADRRRFPDQIIHGAEAILARLWYEGSNKEVYAPIRLGEVTVARAFAATRQANPSAVKASKLENNLLVVEAMELTKQDIQE